MNKLVVLATVCLIGAHGDPDPAEREVNSLSSLQQQQPAPSWNPYGGAQGFANPYMRNYGQPQPIYGQPMGNPYNSFPQMPGQFGMSGGLNWNGGYPQIGGSAGYYPYPDYSYGNPGIESSTSKPDYANDEEDKPESGVEIIESGNNVQNSGVNWNQPSWNQPWNNGMYGGPPSWSSSYTPVGGGCYNRCKPSCSFRPQPPPPPQPIYRPRPRPLPIPMPRPQPMPSPQPAKPNYGCRTTCRPMCNQTPSCGGGAQFNGNTMVCNRPSYNQGLQYGPYGNYYGGTMTTLPAKVEPMAAQSVKAEAVVPNEEKTEEES